MGTILERTGGRIVVQWVDAAGQKRQRTVRKRRADGAPLSVSARRQEARRFLGELEDLVDRQTSGLAPRPLRNPRVTFGELHEHWEATRGAANRSKAFTAFVRRHLVELDPCLAADVTTTRVDKLLTACLEQGLAPKSVMHVRGHLHSVFEAARVQGGPWAGRENPVAAARRFKVAEKLVQVVTPAEWPPLAAEIPERWRAQVAVSFFTGLRRGDVFALRKADVDLERGILSATMSKTEKARLLPIHSALHPYLEEALTTPGPALFAWPKGKRLPNLVKMLRRACGRAGLVTGYEWRCRRRQACGWAEEHASPEVPETCPRCGRDSLFARPLPRQLRFHDLRHSFGTAVVAAGGTGAGQALLAHSDPRMTQRYTHLGASLLGEVVDRAFKSAAPGLQPSGGGGSEPLPGALLQRVARVGPPGLEPGRRSPGSGF